MSDSHDIGISIDGAERDDAPDRSPRVFVYDNYPGGIGFSKPLFEMHGELLDATRRLIADCECENGCPGCVGPIGNTGAHAKAVALRILNVMTAHMPAIEEVF